MIEKENNLLSPSHLIGINQWRTFIQQKFNSKINFKEPSSLSVETRTKIIEKENKVLSPSRLLGINQWRSFIQRKFDNENNFKEPSYLSVELRNKIDYFFHDTDNGKLIPFLKVINAIDSICYDFIAANESVVEMQTKTAAWKYCYEKYERKLEGVKVNCFKSFCDHIQNFKYNLPVAGVVVVNERNEMLCVVQNYRKRNQNKLNFPMGKMDFADDKDLKLTAVRELREETGVELSDAEIESMKRRVKVEHVGSRRKRVHLYMVEGFSRSRVDVNYTKRGEIGGLAWVSPDQVSGYGRSEIDVRMLNPETELPQVAFDVSRIVKHVAVRSRGSRNPFETFGFDRRFKRKITRTTCQNVSSRKSSCNKLCGHAISLDELSAKKYNF